MGKDRSHIDSYEKPSLPGIRETGHLAYGAGICPRCGEAHEAQLHIKEGRTSRFRALQVAMELATRNNQPHQSPDWRSPEAIKHYMDHGAETRTQAKLAALRATNRGHLHLPVENLTKIEEAVLKSALEGPKTKSALVMELTRLSHPKSAIKKLNKTFASLKQKGLAEFDKTSGMVRLMRTAEQTGLPSFTIGDRKFMIGVLVTAGATLVAVSGPNNRNESLKAIAEEKGWIHCKDRGPEGPHRTRFGVPIKDKDYRETEVGHIGGGNAPGNCAAPRLLEEAFERGGLVGSYDEWQMSEVWFEPFFDSQKANNYGHFESAEHCTTCASLVPLLLCPLY